LADLAKFKRLFSFEGATIFAQKPLGRRHGPSKSFTPKKLKTGQGSLARGENVTLSSHSARMMKILVQLG
jgi:hypothetical protein